jgi:Carboxypeptidase regulatory-like domain
MKVRFAGRVLTVAVFCFAVLFLCGSVAQAQTAATGSITGTVTDPSGGAVANVAVTATNKGTNQAREEKTGADGVYTFSLLPPGDYRVKFTASGFKTADVESVTVNVTETVPLNQVLEVGAVTESVTVESTVETLQTETSTLGQTVTGTQINALPMANQNYTEILSLSAGTNVGVDDATSVGKGTQDISANGNSPGSNNYQMDGVQVDNIANSGSANDGTIYTGIPIPSTDAIAEFKVQTSTYDASYGRNPGANVTVSTKSGTNDFHGSAFEFFRNSVLNADDFFYDKTPAEPHQVLDQNQFGGTLGGPIKRDKLFFFFSYRGTRGKNGVAAQGETFGALLPTALNPYAALGSRGTCAAPTAVPDLATIASECDATAQAFATAMGITNPVSLRIFQLTTGKNAGVPENYYIPAPASDPQFCQADGSCDFTVPAIYHENQYVANGDYVINHVHTLTTKYFYTANPQTLYLGQAGGDLPGTPVYTPWGNQAVVAKLTSTLTNYFVNEARVSYQRNNGSATVAVPPGGCPGAGSFTGLQGCGSPDALGLQPLVPGFYEPPTIIDVIDDFTLFGGLLPFSGPTNQLQAADQISWQHGRHSIRAGYEYEWTNWPLVDGGLQQGLELVLGVGSIPGLNGLETGGFGTTGPTAGPGWDVGCIFCVKGITGENGITHFYRLNDQDAYVLDDWKVSSRLTLNIGLRWEYDGLLSDSLGRLTQIWLSRMAAPADVPTTLAAALVDPAGVQQYVVPSNFAAHFGPPPTGVGTASNRQTIEGHTPYGNFAPRFGFAWQPLSNGKLVVRGGGGIFYNRVGLDSVVHAYEQGYPYAATYDYSPPSSRWAEATIAQPYPAIAITPLPDNPALGFAPRYQDAATGVDSSLSTPFDPVYPHTPLVREYSLGIQYEFRPGWVLDVGYVGSSGINLLDYNHNHNQATLATPTNQFSSLCTGAAPDIICNTADNAQFRVPYPGYQTDGLAESDDNGYSSYNSLQVTLRHQFSHGLSTQLAYTWDKDLSDVFFGPSANINLASCMACQYGRVSFDRPQRFVGNYSYDLPFGKGMSGFAGKAFGGWNVSGITIVQGGDPLTFIDSGGTAGVPGALAATGAAYGTSTTSYLDGVSTAQYCPGFNNANILAKGPITSKVGTAPVNGTGYFNLAGFCPAAIVPFGDPTATGFGNSGVGVVLGPGQFNWDISILKNTKITERVTLQFRTDFYNAFNHPQFADPGGGSFGTIGFEDITGTTPVSASDVMILHTNVNPRLIQFGLHLLF